jgi:hypothetical protein
MRPQQLLRRAAAARSSDCAAAGADGPAGDYRWWLALYLACTADGLEDDHDG